VNIAVDHTTGPKTLGALLAEIGPEGVAVLLVVGAVVLTAKSRTFRELERRAFVGACLLTWRLLAAAWHLARGVGHLSATREERRALRRLHPSHWRAHAPRRGLEGTLTGRPKLTASGIVAAVRLDGTWTVGKLRGAEDHVRALLGIRHSVRIEITSGKRGGWAQLTVRTRNAGDGLDLSGWEPGAPWGVDTVTGEPVMVPLGRRMLIAGTSGAGKSWSTRALLAEGSEAEDHRLVVIDPKRVEAINWRHRARTAVTADEVLAVTDELVAEMHERLALVPRGRDTIAISPARPRITVFVDEGAEVIGMSKGERARIIENLRTLARMGRAAEVIVIWATQKPTMDRNGGIDAQISAQITYRAALALSTASEARTVLGEDATERGWHAHDLPMPGYAMLRSGPKAKPHPIRTRAFSPADVIALPDRPVWSRALPETAADSPADSAGDPDSVYAPSPPPKLTLVKDAAPEAVQAPADAVLAALVAAGDGGASVADVVAATGLSQSRAYELLGALVKDGRAVKPRHGRFAVAREVSA
jgi:S-DNA-T family DNA segregation ATPase FtsK/SpoIIIE